MVSQPATPAPDRPNVYGLDLAQLADLVARYEVPKFHARQIYRWLYVKREFSANAWTDLPRSLRERLAAEIDVDPGRITARVEAADGTVKYGTTCRGDVGIESVYMVQDERVTLCLSSQAGCALGCEFCLTARMGLARHLTPGEILGQVALIQRDQKLDEVSFNLVYMGMGEPLHNYESVAASIRLLTDPLGFGISRRRITVSTSGLAPEIERLAREPVRPCLAVSLNATTDSLRSRLMPINRKYPIERLLQACRTFAQASRERFTLEYVLLRDVNDSEQDVERLTRIVRRVPAKLNLIPFNAVPGRLPFSSPSRERVLRFRQRLLDQRVPVSIRWSRGADARAACGQLATEPAGLEASRTSTHESPNGLIGPNG
jgi:23S rRNA (adenine2503-C2)-methyltransferase